MKSIVSRIKGKFDYIRKMSQIRLFAIVLLIVVVPITIIAGFSFTLVINEARSRYVYTLNSETQQLAGTLSAVLGNLLSVGRMIINDEKFTLAISDYRYGVADRDATAEKLGRYMTEYENTSFMATSLTPRIALITRENEKFGHELAGNVLEKHEFLGELITLYGTNQNVKWTSDAEVFSLERPGYADCLYLILAVRDRNTFKTVATVIMQQRVNVLANRIIPNMYDYQTVIVANRSGRRLLDLDYLGVADDLGKWIDIDTMEVQSDRSFEKTIDGMNCVITNYTITKSDWNVVGISNMISLTSLRQSSLRSFILALVVCLMIAFLLAYRFSKRFMKPVIHLNNQMKLVRDGDMNASIEPTSDDEIGELTVQFNDMLDHINHLMQLNQKKQEEKRLSDIRFLQTQINPHFIYNTLTLLRYSVLTSNKDQADKIILALNGILRYALSGSDQFVTLNRALEWIKNYLVIVNCSMKEPVDAVYELEEGTGDYQIMRMLIQPIVENAAFHGLKKCETTPKLKISTYVVGNDMIISIWDNGPGFDTDELSKSKADHVLKSIGVDNVDQRIRLYFGEKYGVRYRSYKEGLGEGTEAIILIPIIKKEDGDVLINEHTDSR